MESKSPFVLIGAAVLAFVVAIAAFIVWKVGRTPAEEVAYYKVMFDVDVQGLTRDSPVFYRGIRVGRVHSIGLERRDEPRRGDGRLVKVEKIAVVVAVPQEIEIHDRTRAVFEKPLVAGASFIQLIGKSEDSKALARKRLDQPPYPEIPEAASFFQTTTMTAQDLIARAGQVAERLNELLSPDTVRSFQRTLANIDATTSAIARNEGNLDKALADLPRATADLRSLATKMDQLIGSASLIVAELGPQDDATRAQLAGRAPGELRQTLGGLRSAIDGINATTANLNRLVTDNRAPLRQFTEGGLVELNAALRELRNLTGNLSAITTRLERDPAGYLINGKQGYQPR